MPKSLVELLLSIGISVLAPNSPTLYTLSGIRPHNYFLWPGPGLGTESRLCQCGPPLLVAAFRSGLVRHPSVPLLTLDRFPGYGLCYPAGSDSIAIRRTILTKSRLVRWLSASKSQ